MRLGRLHRSWQVDGSSLVSLLRLGEARDTHRTVKPVVPIASIAARGNELSSQSVLHASPLDIESFERGCALGED